MANSTMPMSAEEARRLALEVSNERRSVEEEIQSNMEVLRSQNATMTSPPLVDNQGFPNASVDIVAIRNARSRLIALRNDRHRLESRMRELLDVALARNTNNNNNIVTNGFRADDHQEQSNVLTNGVSQAMAHVPGTNGTLSINVPVRQNGDGQAWSEVGGLTPFARVNAISANSPAELADLRVGDLILKFGELNASMVHSVPANRDLINLPSVIQRGTELTITVLRQDQVNSQVKLLRLTPMDGWGGRGLLGCHLLPV